MDIRGDTSKADFKVPADIEDIIGDNPARYLGHYNMFGDLNKGEANIIDSKEMQDMIGPERDGDADPLDDAIQDKIQARDAVEHVDSPESSTNFVSSEERDEILADKQTSHDALDERLNNIEVELHGVGFK